MEERFDAKITLDINDFLRKMKEIDQKIRDFATEAQKPISLDSDEFSVDMQRAKMEVEKFVQKASKPIDADFDDFYAAIATGKGATAEFLRKANKPFDADLNDFYTDLLGAEAKTKEFVREATKPIDVDISAYLWGLRVADAETKRTLTRSVKSIGADISEFMRKAALVSEKARSLAREHVVVRVKGAFGSLTQDIEKFQNRINRIATNVRAFGELIGTTFRGIGMTLSPALVPIIATLGGLIGQLGPMIGTLSGSTFALATAFGGAGIAAGAFASVAVSNLKDVFSASADLKELQEKLANADTGKERAKILEEIAQVQGSLTTEQTKAYESMKRLSATWQELSSSLQKPTIQIFTDFLSILNTTLRKTRPLFESSVAAVSDLTKSLTEAINGDKLKSFFDFLNNSGAQMLTVLGKSFGNFTSGLFSMMSAFGPLANDTANGFLEMSQRFSDWAAGLSESAKFQTFVDYVNTNMPKLRAIFGDAFKGIINMFAAFGPSSADLMTSMQNMMARFREWSSTLSENQGFQNFINYVKENGPAVAAAIANMTVALVNIGIALAPIGARILELVNGFVQWTNKMMQTHPIIGQIGAALLVMTGILIAFAPNLIAFGTLFASIGGKVIAATSLMRLKFVTGMSMMVQSMVQTAAAMTTATAKFIAKWTLLGVQSMIHGAKVAAAWTLAFGKKMALGLATMIATASKIIARWVWMGVQSMIHGARMAAAWVVAMGPIGWVTAAVIGLAILIIANWDKVRSKTVEIWNKVSAAVKDAWQDAVKKTQAGIKSLVDKVNEMVSKVKGFKDDFLRAGGDLIQGLIDGILGKVSSAIAVVKGVGEKIIGTAKKIFDINSPSRVFSKIGNFIGQGLSIGISETERQNKKVMNDLGVVLRDMATANAKKITDIQSVASKERQALEKESAQKSKEIAEKASRDISDIQKKAAASDRSLTAAERIRIENIREDSNKKIMKNEQSYQAKMSEIAKKSATEIAKMESEASKERLEGIKKFIDDKKKFEGLSLLQEVNIWRKSVEAFKEGTEEKKEAQLAYEQTVKQVSDRITAINEEYEAKAREISNRLVDNENRLTEAYQNAVSERAKALNQFSGLFDYFESKIDQSGQELLANLQSQVDGFKLWQSEIEKLSSKAIDQGLIAELTAMGPQALPQLLALNTMTEAELSTYSNLYAEKSRLAREQAVKELEYMREDTANQIDLLRAEASKELDFVKNEWTGKIKEINQVTKEEFKDLRTIGKEAINGLIAGMASMQGALTQKATELAAEVEEAIRKTLKVHSPSRITTDIGIYIGQGLVEGMRNMTRKVMQTSQRLALAAVPQRSDIGTGEYRPSTRMDAIKRKLSDELELVFKLENLAGVNSSGDGSITNNYYATINASDIKELQDLVRIFDPQQRNRLGRNGEGI